jgi:preprotein translocase subunit SecE
MTTQGNDDDKLKDAESAEGEASSEESNEASEAGEALAVASESGLAVASDESGEGGGEDGDSASTFGSERYVHAAFFVAGILAAYVASKTLAMTWNSLAAWSTAVRAVPQLVTVAEEQRESYSLVAGAAIGTLVVVQSYRKEHVRTWASEVASELSKVTWPTREAVMNGTVVVVVASALATVYVTILDRIWSFLTTLVYGA